jgi:phenylalanyl-tRNA synthetase beta chain
MPVVGIPVERLRALLGRPLDPQDLLRHLGHLGCDVEGYTQLERVRCRACGAIHERTSSEEIPPACEVCGAELRASCEALPPLEVIRMELLAVRPDMFDPGGLARALRGYLEIETGLPRYPVGPPAARLTVDAAVRDPRSYRPWIVAAVLENVTLDPDALKIVMKLQENLHWAIGRNRKHASIGVYDFDTVEPELVYGVGEPATRSFVPLGAQSLDARHAMTLREILARHPKGIAFAGLLADHARYPLLTDRTGRVLSMPPIINSEETKVTAASRRLVIDVTGLAERTVGRTLNILVSSLCENLPGVQVRAVEIRGPGEERRVTPDFAPQAASVSTARAARVLGVDLDPEQGAALLRRMRHDVTVQGDALCVSVPAYRNDILHERDLVEDLGIAYGYHNIVPSLVPTFTVGDARAIETLAESTRALLCGLGFLEVMTLLLTGEEVHDRGLGRAPAVDAVRLANPVSSEQTMLRTSLLPGILETFRRNVIHPLPQSVFEIGEVTLLDSGADTGARDVRNFACGEISPRAGFEEIKAIADAIGREFRRPWRLEPLEAAPFLRGRAAVAILEGGGPVLRFGEVHPDVLERFGLQNPTVLLEGDLEALGGTAASAATTPVS